MNNYGRKCFANWVSCTLHMAVSKFIDYVVFNHNNISRFASWPIVISDCWFILTSHQNLWRNRSARILNYIRVGACACEREILRTAESDLYFSVASFRRSFGPHFRNECVLFTCSHTVRANKNDFIASLLRLIMKLRPRITASNAHRTKSACESFAGNTKGVVWRLKQ